MFYEYEATRVCVSQAGMPHFSWLLVFSQMYSV